MVEKPLLYFKQHTEWRLWLAENHSVFNGVYLIFYKVENEEESMRWEEAVKVALCFGWIDSTVKSLGNGKRKQAFSPRNEKSVWSALNKRYIKELVKDNLMHQAGLDKIKIGKQNGSWTALDAVEKGIIPEDLQFQFNENPKAFINYQSFALVIEKAICIGYIKQKEKLQEKKEFLILFSFAIKILNLETIGNCSF